MQMGLEYRQMKTLRWDQESQYRSPDQTIPCQIID